MCMTLQATKQFHGSQSSQRSVKNNEIIQLNCTEIEFFSEQVLLESYFIVKFSSRSYKLITGLSGRRVYI